MNLTPQRYKGWGWGLGLYSTQLKSGIKQFLRSREARTLELLDQAMADAVNYITEDDAFGWFNHCGLFT